MSFNPDDNKWPTPARPCKHCGRRAWLDRDGVLRERKGGPEHVCSGVTEKRWVYDRHAEWDST